MAIVIDSGGSTSNISIGLFAKIALDVSSTVAPLRIEIEDINTTAVTIQANSSYNAATRIFTYRVNIPSYDSGHSYRVKVIGVDLSSVNFPVTVVAATENAESRSNYLPMYLALDVDAGATNALTSINSGIVRVGSTGNTALTAGYATATGLTIGGVATTAFAGSANSFTFNVPAFSTGITLPVFGSATATITDGTTPANLGITFLPLASQDYITLTSVGSGIGYIGNSISCSIGDQIIFDTAATRGVTNNRIDASGAILSDFGGTQTMWHRNGTSGVITELSVVTDAVGDHVADVYTFTDLTNQARSSVIESNPITVAGVTAATNIGISVVGGEYAVNTGGGYGAWTSVAGNVQLGHLVKVRGTSSAAYSTATDVVLTIGTVSDTFTITTLANVGNTIVSINSGTVRVGSTGNTLVTTGYASITGLTIGGVSVTALAGSANSHTFSIPDFSTGLTLSAFGTVSAVATDGTTPSNQNVIFAPKATQSFVTLTSVGSGIGYVGNYITCAIGDQIVFDLPATLGVAANSISASGGIATDYQGTQTMWHRNGTTGYITEISVITPDVTADVFAFTDVTNQTISAVIESNVITIAGVTAGTDIITSVTGGEWARNTGGGFGAFTASAGVVRLGDTVKVRGVASASYSTASNVVLNVGGVNDTFTITTQAAPAATISSVNSGVVRVDSTGNTLITTNLPGATGLTIGGVAMNAFAGSNNSYTFNAPILSGGNTIPAFGTVSAVATDGSASPSLAVSFQPKVTQAYVTLTSVNTAVGYVGNYLTCAIGDQIVFDLPGTLGVVANGVDLDGRLFSDYSGTQTMWHRNGTSGLLTELSVVTPAVATDTVPDQFTFTDQTSLQFGAVAVSGAIVVSGIDTASPISITGGEYSVNSGGFTSTAGTVVNGDSVEVRVTTSAVALTAVSATLTIGTVSDVFSATTRAYDTTPSGFNFTPVSSATISTQYVSNSITVTGVDAGVDVPISITGGEYAVDSGGGFGAYTAVPGVVRLGYQVRTRLTSSGSGNTTVTSTVDIGTVTGVYAVGTGVLDLTPDNFSFTSVTGAEINTQSESSTVTVAGVTAGVDIAISVTNGEYAVNTGGGFGAFTSVGGTVRLGDIVKTRGTSSSSYATGNVTTLDIGGTTGTYTITTRVADTTPTVFNLTPQTNAELSTVTTSNAITVAGVDAGVNISISIVGGLYSIDGGAYTAMAGNVQLGQTVTARLTSSASFNTANTATLTIGGVPDVFSVTTRMADTVPNDQNFATVNNGEPYDWGTSAGTVVTGVDIGVNIPISISGGEYSIDSGGGYGAWTNVIGVIQGGWSVRVRVAVNNTFLGSATTTLNIGTTPSTFTVITRAADVIPNGVTFTPVTDAAISTLTTSNAVFVNGVDDGVDISISVADGEYSVNGGAFTAVAGNVRLSDSIRVRRNSSGLNSTAVSATLTLGGVDASFFITTAAASDTTPDPFGFTSATNVALTETVVSNVIAIQGTTPGVDVPVTITGGEYSIDPDTGVWGPYTSNAGLIRYNHQVRVRGTSSATPSTATNVILNVGGVDGTFSITTRVVDTVPSQFTFTDVSGVSHATMTVSNAITVSGVDAGINIPISIAGGAYSINNGGGWGAYTSSDGVVQAGWSVRVRIVASSQDGGTVTSTLTIGTVVDIFTVTTITPVDVDPNAPSVTLETTTYESNSFLIEGVTPGAPVSISVDACEYAVDSGGGFGAWTDLDGVVYLNDAVKVRMIIPGAVVEGSEATVTLGDGTYFWTVTVSGGEPPVDVTPDQFIIPPVPNASISTLVESRPFAVTGVDAGEDIPVEVMGLEWSYSRNGIWSAYRYTPGIVRLGDEIRVRIMSSATLNGVVMGSVSVGLVAGDFIVTSTTAIDVTPDIFSFANVSELEPNEDVSSTVVTVAGISTTAVINCNVTNGFYSVNSGNGWGPWLTAQSTVRLGYRVRVKGRANRLKGGTTVVGLTIGTVSTNWTVRTTSKTVSSSTPTTKYSNFTYPLQPASATVRDRILILTETLVPGTVTATVRRKAIWNDVLDLVRYTDYTLPSMPAIDFTGFAYRNLPSLLLAVNSTGSSSSFRTDYYAAMEYIVRECWQELTLLMSSQADCTVNGVVIRTNLITLQCVTKS